MKAIIGLTSLLAASLGAAYPSAIQDSNNLVKRRAPTYLSGRSNTGVIKSTNFDAKDQRVDISPGSGHEFQTPKAGDLRGECPGLNAAANHNYLPRNGIASITQTVTGLQAAFNMSPDLSAFLAAVSVALIGDYLTNTWSIGGSYGSSLPGLGQPRGILGAHNRYEGDASPARGDAYLNGGNQILSLDSFRQLLSVADANGEFSLDSLAAHNDYVAQYSVQNNPYYFSAPFAGLVTPAAHEFIVNFMSNHSAARPSGYLNTEILKTFFAITGSGASLTHHPGMERIPANFFRRPSTNQYTAPANLADTAIAGTMYPGVVRFGGNTGTVNSFTGVDIGNLTGGVYDGRTLLDRNGANLGCFAIQFVQAGLADQLVGAGAGALQAVTRMLDAHAGPVLSALECPEMKTVNSGVFDQYPGYSYDPKNPTSG